MNKEIRKYSQWLCAIAGYACLTYASLSGNAIVFLIGIGYFVMGILISTEDK